MSRALLFLESHWLVVLLLVIAAGLGLRAALRSGRRVSAVSAITLGLYAVGSLSLGNLRFTFEDAGSLGFTITKFQVSWAILAATATLFTLSLFVLLLFHRWSYRLAIALATLSILALGAWTCSAINAGLNEVGSAIRHTVFVRPWWLTLLVFVPVIFWISRRSLSGLGTTRKWVAISARALAVLALVLALAEPRVRRPSENVTVIFVVDRSFSVPRETADLAGKTVDRRWERIKRLVEDSVRKRGVDRRNDQAGLVFFGKRPKLVLPPTAVEWIPVDEQMAGPVDGNYTDIAAALKLAMASFPEGTARRIVLVSDGNQNLGSALDQAELGRKTGVQIDSLALAPDERNENEVLITDVDAPTISAEGDRRLIRVVLRNEHPTRVVEGELTLTRVGGDGSAEEIGKGVNIPIDTSSPQVAVYKDQNGKTQVRVRLMPKLNVFRFIDDERSKDQRSYTYKADFRPERSTLNPDSQVPTWVEGLPGDRAANNQASAAVVARGRRRVLFLDAARSEATSPHLHLIKTLRSKQFTLEHLGADRLPADINDLGVFLSNYDCILLANVPAETFTNGQMEVIRNQVHDQGCGLVMVGGPDSFGPGGYQQTPIEAALPVDCEIKAKRAMGKGGLILIMHASEMADGNKWQKEIAKLAIQRLNPADMVGVYDFGVLGGAVNPQIPFQEIGTDKERLFTKIDRMTPGDMPDFDPFLKVAADTLSDPKHNLATKHVILISDGDPNYSGPGQAAVKLMADSGITCTTVGVATHGVNEDNKMKMIAAGTKDANGNTGNFYKVSNPNQLPAIYIKESRRVSQSFIYDKVFDPQVRIIGGPTDALAKMPQLHGFVRTTKKESPLCDMLIEGPQDKEQQFPVLASWRYGLGKAVAYTSDARSQPTGTKGWDRDWLDSDVYAKFWEQTVNWAMREAERGKMAVQTEYREGRVRVRVDAQDERGKPIGNLRLEGKVTTPGKPRPGDKPPQLEFRPIGPGQYEAEFLAEEEGAYFVNVQGVQVQVGKDGKEIKGTDGKLLTEVFDAARAGVTVPYSPEFADMESNTPLLRQLAELTGGKYFKETDDLAKIATDAELFRRGPEVVRAVLPFWFWLVFAAGVLILLDVGTRRISLEWKEVRGFALRNWASLRAKPYEEVESEGLGALLRRKRAVGDVLAKKKATRKFEVDDAADVSSAPEGADDYTRRTDTGPRPATSAPTGDRTAPPPEEDDGDDFMTRMRKAKERGKKQ